jgi:large subunit ribosomal protein L10
MSSAVERKKAVVEELAEKLGGAKAFYLTDFTGLDVQKMTELRARMREADVEYLVVKNTLALRAMEGLEDVPDMTEFFKGPTGLVIGREDAVTAAKVLSEFAKEHNDRPSVKVGIVERQAFGPEQVGRLAKLPPREQLLAELAGAMQAPMATLLMLMQAKAQELVGLLEALRAEREDGA